MMSSVSLPAVSSTTPGGDEEVRWIVIAVVGWAEAEVLRSKLDAAGIPCILQREAAGAVLGITIGTLGEVRVLVPEPVADQAVALLNEQTTDEELDGEDEAGDWDDYDIEGGRKTTPGAATSD